MLSKQRAMDLASEFASSSKQLAAKSLGPHKVSWPRYDLSSRGRLRLKRIVERFLCLREDDSSHCPPAAIQVPASVKDGNGFVVKLANTCFEWFKRKSSPVEPKEEEEENDKDKEDNEEEEQEKEEVEEEKEEEEEEKEEDEDAFAVFRPVIKSMDLGTLPTYASSIRRSEAGMSSNQTTEFECTVDFKPMMGSFHALFPIVFNDGVRWLFKVPAAGYAGHWDESAARSLTSEALTMRMLQQKTSVPVPKVHSYNSSLENEFHCPFILMDFIDGKPLYESKSFI